MFYRALRPLILIVAFAALGCSSLLYNPTRVLYVDPKKLPTQPQAVRFKSADGENLFAWHFVPAKQSARARVVYFHGNGQNLSAQFLNLYWLVDQGFELLVFDYPGYGLSSGEPTPANTVAAGIAALDWSLRQKPRLPLAVVGQSLGGAVAMSALLRWPERQSVCLIVADSTFLSYRAVARDALARQWWTWWLQPLTYLVLSDRHAPGDRVRELAPIPFLVIHQEEDQIISVSRGEEVFAAAGEPKEFWRAPGKDHNLSLFEGPDRLIYRTRLVKTLNERCSVGLP